MRLFVLFEHGTAHGREEVGSGFYRFDGAEVFFGHDVVALFGHVDVHYVAKLLGSVFRDTDEADVAFYFNVFVGIEVFEHSF